MINLDKQWAVTLADGRRVIVGAGVEPRGVWMLNPSSPLLQRLTTTDVEAITAALRAASEHLEANPPTPPRRPRRP